MNRRNTLTMTAMALLCLGVALPANAQTFKQQVVGTWMMTSNYEVYQDGKRNEAPFGPDQKGMMMIDPNGRFSLQLIGGGRPKTERNPRNPVGPAVSYFGSYSINEGDKTLTFHIERATFPNLDGTDQKRTVTIKGDELSYVTEPITSPQGPFVPHVEWKRAK